MLFKYHCYPVFTFNLFTTITITWEKKARDDNTRLIMVLVLGTIPNAAEGLIVKTRVASLCSEI